MSAGDVPAGRCYIDTDEGTLSQGACVSTVRSASHPLVRRLLVAVGVVCVGLGFAGVFVPLLPTTPFLLLAAACFIRSSQRFYTWLTTNRFVGSYVRNYMEHRATTMVTKVTSLSMLWIFIGASAVFFTESWIVRALLLVVAVGVTIHLVSLRTIERGRCPRGIIGRRERDVGG
ncbi:MAG: DUF454 family protein [Candidatus Eisenbacteria bacterium]|nr:DUF454 family protein [Candidatus Eisenbacteria bacterium]